MIIIWLIYGNYMFYVNTKYHNNQELEPFVFLDVDRSFCVDVQAGVVECGSILHDVGMVEG